MGQLKSGDCASGALGASIGEVVGEALGKNLIKDREFSNADREIVKAVSSITAAFGTSAAGGDARIARDSAENAVENNLADTLWDITNLGFGSTEFYLAYKKGDIDAMAEAAIAIGIDLAATALPFVPDGAGTILKAKKAGKKSVSKKATRGGSGDGVKKTLKGLFNKIKGIFKGKKGKDTLKSGPHAKESIPARDANRNFYHRREEKS